MKTKSERINLFFNELGNVEPASSIEEAISQVEQVLDEVEDKYSGLPYDRSNWGKGERMYLPPLSVAGAWKITEEFKRANLSGNYFYIHTDGSMACADWNSAVIKWAKAGATSWLAPKVGEVHPDKSTWASSKYDEYVPPDDDLAKRLQDYEEDEDTEPLEEPKPAESSMWNIIGRLLKKNPKN